jgi:hypothetical protein
MNKIRNAASTITICTMENIRPNVAKILCLNPAARDFFLEIIARIRPNKPSGISENTRLMIPKIRPGSRSVAFVGGSDGWGILPIADI